jgi:hypothetical protein
VSGAPFGNDNLDFLSDNAAPQQTPQATIFSQPAAKAQPDFSIKAASDPFSTVKPAKTSSTSDPFTT